MAGNGGAVGNESDRPTVASSIVDENGHLQTARLTEGMLTMRHTKDGNEVVFSWVPDDPEGQSVERRISIAGGPAEGPSEYLACLENNSDKGIAAVWTCASHLVD